MKNKSKKRWDWTNKNLRKTRNEGIRNSELPRKAKREYNKFYRLFDKRNLLFELNEKDFEYIQCKRRRTETAWMFW